MPYYFMRDTPLQAMEQLMMSQPGQKPRGGGIYRSPFHYTPKDVACEYCQNYVRKHPCRLCECTCLDERIEAGVLELNEFVQDCFAPSMGPQFRKRMHQQLRERNPQFFLSDAHRRRWTHWRERCWRLSDRNKAALFLLTAYESLWRRMVWKCGNDGFDFQSVHLGGIEPELYSVYQAAKAIASDCRNITLADLASPELVTDEAFQLITCALLMARYGHAHGHPEDHGNVQLQWLMRWAQTILFCGGLIYAAVDDLRTRTVNNIVCIAIAMAGLITISPASLLGALLAMLPFYLCAGFGLIGGGDWRLAAAVGFVLGVGRVLTGFLFMAAALLLASLVMHAFPALRQSAAKKQPLVPYFAAAFIPAYFL